ncbi:hypothetical protein SSX86_030173 [Deinandra increscens subsp. villosa]|uniref:Retrovirus-related Pol polyprotein from transposon RE1 n=1 Tax=Deinandra increscens subsp. villosa TaxID=3103831 RepID=A0AAP0C7J8_9ASTR
MTDGRPITTTTISLTSSSLTMVTFSSSLKLTTTNYLSWKTQIEALLQGLVLYKFIDGTHLAPLPTTDAAGKATPHANFNTWFRQDRLLFDALVGSLTPSIVPLITSAKTSLDAWKIMSDTYASTSRGHLKQLQYRLKQTTKTPTQSITDYMQTIKNLVDQLAILGKVTDDEDVTGIVLNGLDQTTYKPVIDAVHARNSSIPFHKLHEKLINQELSILQSNPPTTTLHQPATVFAAQTRRTQWPPRNSSSAPGLLPTPTTTNPPSKYLGKFQYCFVQGHSIHGCFTFKKDHPNVTLPRLPRANNSNNKPQAHMMQVSSNQAPSNSNWLFDSGASHHITNDLSTLSMHTPYDGTEELVIGDGSFNSPLRLHAFTDADWGGDKTTYRSTTGYIIYLGANPISWSSKRQTTLARSSTEAEFRAVAATTVELQWLMSLLSELGYTSQHTPVIFCDNLSATIYSANPIFHSRMKHLALDFQFVREKVHAGTIRVTHIASDDQLADALTKPLLKSHHHYLLNKIGLISRSSILREHVKPSQSST